MYDKATEKKSSKSFQEKEETLKIIYFKQRNSEHVYLPHDMGGFHIN